MTKTKTTTTPAPTAEQRRMAAVSRMYPRGSRDSSGNLLPLRYRAAEKAVAAYEAAQTAAGLHKIFRRDGTEIWVTIPTD